jgi:predicted nucleic acid-binding protein
LKQYVVDASVVLKWYLKDEKFEETALGLLHHYAQGNIGLVAPWLLEYELANGLLIACRRGRIDVDVALTAMNGFAELGLRLVSISDLSEKVAGFSKKYNRTAYDAGYLAVAAREGVDLITADERLYNSVKMDFGWVKWLAECEL